jgi:hypothetical protein
MTKKKLSGIFLVLLLCCSTSLFSQKNSCVECHSKLEDELKAPVEGFKSDIHQQFGLSCKDCHGGNPDKEDADLAKDKSFKGVPSRLQIPQLCGSCHSNSVYMKKYKPGLRVDQLAQYWTSRHGQLLKKGDTKPAVCTDCHGVHGIQVSSYPKSHIFPWNIPQTCGRCHSDREYMKTYKISTNQVEEYKQSVHAKALFKKKDLSAPVCNDCHGNHGAAPPEIASIAFVCRQCHPSTGELFAKSPHKKAFDELGISECEACHGRHNISQPSDSMLGTGKDSVCIECHEPGSKAYVIAEHLSQKLATFISLMDESNMLLAKGQNKGVEVSEPKFKLQDANTLLIQIRNLTHSLSTEEIEAKIGEGEKVISEVQNAGEEALKEAKLRRTGLVIATLFLMLLAAALYLKVRQIQKSTHSE